MALALESAGRVRQKARAITRNPYVFYALKAFFLYHAEFNSNADLQILEIDAATAIAGDGQDHGIDAACQLYVAFVQKLNEGTDAWFRVIDDADNDSEVIGDVRIEAALLEGNDVFIAVYPNGLPFADGVVSTFTTTPGDTATQVTAAQAGNGFLIIGA